MKNILLFSLGLVIALFLTGCNGHFEEVEKEVGMQGLAKINCFLAAERFIDEMGGNAKSHASLPELYPSHHGMVCVMASALSTDVILGELDDWVYDGGTLVCFLQKDEEAVYWDLEEELPIDPFKNYFGIDVSIEEESPLVPDFYFGEDSIMGEHYETDFDTVLTLKEEEDEEFSLYQEFPHGDGTIIVWSTAMPFTTENLNKEQHATMFWDMVSAVDPEEVWLIYFGNLSFWGLLWRKGSLAIISGVLLLITWIWYRAKRFGPSFLTVDATRNTLREHLSSTGAFFAKYDADVLIVNEEKRKMIVPLARLTNMPINSSMPELLEKCYKQNILSAEQLALLSQDFPEKKREKQIYIQKLQALSKSL